MLMRGRCSREDDENVVFILLLSGVSGCSEWRGRSRRGGSVNIYINESVLYFVQRVRTFTGEMTQYQILFKEE